MSNDTIATIVTIGVPSIIGLSISYFIIHAAVKEATRDLRQHARIQTDLLARMAMKAGVTPDEIQQAYLK